MGCGASATPEPAPPEPTTPVGFGRTNFVLTNRLPLADFYAVDRSRKLGTGGFGTVSKARQKATGSVRAVKSISKARVTDINLCWREVAVMKLMDHPNIVKLYEIFEDACNIYLVMELCSGGELFDRIIECGHFTEAQAASIMRQIVLAVNYMHENRVCHRDLKPENFLFMTQVLHGKYDQLCDVWSCGVIMYMMLSGTPPFPGKTDEEVLAKVRLGKFDFDGKVWRKVSEDAKGLICMMLTMHPKERCSASEALNHVWIRQKAPQASNVPLHDDVVDHLRNFSAQNKLRQAALQIIASQLKDDQIKPLKETFMALDENGDGLLTVAEMKAGMYKAGLKEIPPDLQMIMDNVDSNCSGLIDYTEFLAATLDKRHFDEESAVWSAFRLFDRDGDGKITMEELKQVLSDGSVNDVFSPEVVDGLMNEVDTTKDGTIDFQEFMVMIRGKALRS